MNLLFLHTVAIDPQKGGIEKVSRLLADELTARGHVVSFLSMMDVFRETCDTARQSFFPCEKIYSEENEKFLKQFLKEKQIELCIFQAGDDKRVPFPHVFREAGVRLIVAVHTDPEFFKQLVRGKFELKYGRAAAVLLAPVLALKILLRKIKQARLYKTNAAAAEKVVLLSEKFIPVYSKYIRKEDRAKLCAIPNPAEKPAETVAEKQNEILYVGRMTLSEKRVDLLLKVWAAVQNEFPEWRLTLVGGGRDEERIRKMSEKLKLRRISFEGFQKPEKYYARASIFCLTSAFEGFGLVLAEASAYGCVPVAFDSYLSAKDVIQSGENGFLIKAFDTNCYAEALRELMKNPTLRNRLSAAARVNADRFAPEKIVSRWEKLFKE